MEQFPVIVASNRILQEFNDLVNPILKQINVLIFSNQKLKEARDILLPRLMEGTIEV